jgi:pyroglutamyl-peptidase
MKLLITGFGPFDKFDTNPAQIIAERISERDPDIDRIILPVVYGEAKNVLEKELHERKPDAVISLGLNAKIGWIDLEEVAVNIRASEIADNSGKVLSDEPIVRNGSLAYRTLLPTSRIRDRLRKEGIPAKHSYSAGVYLCNEVFYTEMAWAAENGKKAGFIHIPLATEIIADRNEFYKFPHMSLDMIERACRIAVDEVKYLSRSS